MVMDMFPRLPSSIALLTDQQISDAMVRIVREAKKELTLVFAYHDQWPGLKHEIAEAQLRNVDVKMYYRSDADNGDPSLHYQGILAFPVQGLHAKIYANESVALITSMNLHQHSALNSREVGLLIRDEDLRTQIAGFVQSLSSSQNLNQISAMLDRINDPQSPRSSSSVVWYCIACRRVTQEYSPNHPFCQACVGTVFPRKNDGTPDYDDQNVRATAQLYCYVCGDKHEQIYFECPMCTVCVTEHRGFCVGCKRPLDDVSDTFVRCKPCYDENAEPKFCHFCGKANPSNHYTRCWECHQLRQTIVR